MKAKDKEGNELPKPDLKKKPLERDLQGEEFAIPVQSTDNAFVFSADERQNLLWLWVEPHSERGT